MEIAQNSETSASRALGLVSGDRAFVAVTLFPALLLIGVYIYAPLFYSFYLSFFRTRLFSPAKFVGLDQYVLLLTDHVFWIALGNTLAYTAASVLLTLALGLASALLLERPLAGRVTLSGPFSFCRTSSHTRHTLCCGTGCSIRVTVSSTIS